MGATTTCPSCQQGAVPDGNHPRTTLGGWLWENKISALQNLSRDHRNVQPWGCYLTALKGCKKALFALSIILRPKKFTKKKFRKKKEITRNVSGTSSDPSAQSKSPLHFRDAEMQPPLAHTYSLEEQVGDAGYKHIF